MSTNTSGTTPQKGGLRRWAPWLLILVVLVAAIATTERVPLAVADQVDPDAFNPTTYAVEVYAARIDPYVRQEAIPLAELVEALELGAAESDYGNTPGTASSFSFAVSLDGSGVELKGPVLRLDVEGIDPEITVQLQVGPALNGTALRDVTGTISFNEFTNQLEYQQIGTELNNIVRSSVLTGLDVESLAGKQLRITGAYTRVNPKLISIVPTSIEVLS